LSPRQRKIGDAEVVAAAALVVMERGAENTRLSDVAAATGLAAATLIQRFGTREALLAAVAASLPGQVAAVFAAARRDLSPLDALAAALARLAEPTHLRMLMQASTDAALWGAYSLEVRKQIGLSLLDAMNQSEIPPVDRAEAGRALQLAFYGAAAAALLEGGTFDSGTAGALVQRVLNL
jgi:AcrR family transcriptional regulator